MKITIFCLLGRLKIDGNKLEAECSSKRLGTIFGFFNVCRKLANCRSPPKFKFKRKKLEWRKERWQKALKEENVRITLIH